MTIEALKNCYLLSVCYFQRLHQFLRPRSHPVGAPAHDVFVFGFGLANLHMEKSNIQTRVNKEGSKRVERARGLAAPAYDRLN